jgi:hypothetical protein
VIQPVLHLHVCASPTPAESAATSADHAADSAAGPIHSVADYAIDSAVAGAAPIETS